MFFKIIMHILMPLMVTYAENRPFSLVADSVKGATIEKKWTPRKMFPKGSGMKINHQNEFLKPIPRDYRACPGLVVTTAKTILIHSLSKEWRTRQASLFVI